MLEALTILLLKEKKKNKQQILSTSTKKTKPHYKPILSSHTIAPIGCTSHCSTGKIGKTSKIGNPGSTQKGNNLCASQELGHNAALYVTVWFYWLQLQICIHITCLQLPRRKPGKNLQCCTSPSEKKKI